MIKFSITDKIFHDNDLNTSCLQLPHIQQALREMFLSITKYQKKTSQALHIITDIICDPRHTSEFRYHGLLINQTKKLPNNILVHSKNMVTIYYFQWHKVHWTLWHTGVLHRNFWQVLFWCIKDNMQTSKKNPKFSCFISSTAGNPFGKLKKCGLGSEPSQIIQI